MSLNMKAIANLAGVSVATVSRAFRDPNKVSTSTRELVLETARANNYTYNAAAGDISSCQSRVIGVLVPTTSNALFATSLTGIQDELSLHGFSTMQGSTKYDFDTEQMLLNRFLERRVAGIIMAGFNFGQEKYLKKITQQNDIPVVIMWEKPEHDLLNYVGINNFEAAYKAVQHLTSSGHKKIGLIIGPYDKVGRINQRYLGYKKALEDAGIEVNEKLIIKRTPTYFDGQSAMNVLLDSPTPPTAIFAASDVLAIGAMNAAQARGMSIPDNISIMGFDNAPVSGFMNPPLSTIGIDAYQIGTMSAKLVLNNVMNEPRHYCLNSDLLIRKSCKAI